jgi:ribosomal protein L37AE/L43A
MATNVTNRTRAGHAGKLIDCPHCCTQISVGHFAWSVLVCTTCGNEVPKQEWLVDLTPYELKAKGSVC